MLSASLTPLTEGPWYFLTVWSSLLSACAKIHYYNYYLIHTLRGFPGGSVVKNPPANAGDMGLILGQEYLLEKEMAIHSSTLAWKILWTEEPGGLQSMGSHSRT